MKAHLLFWAAVLGAAFSMAGCAGHGGYREIERAEYWMKDYAGADQAKVSRCYRLADAEFDKYVDLNWGPTLMKANAWEACMEGRAL